MCDWGDKIFFSLVEYFLIFPILHVKFLFRFFLSLYNVLVALIKNCVYFG